MAAETNTQAARQDSQAHPDLHELPACQAAVKSSLITPVFKKGDESDTSSYRPIAVGEPLCGLYAAIPNSRIVNWAESNGLRAPCPAGFRPRLSTEYQLFALRHFIDRSKS